jgi:RNA polymerase sigma factor (sigma-70 family)
METVLAQSTSLLDPDACLVERVALGDEAALRALYAAYGRRMNSFALRLTGDDLVAEEVLQDCLLAVWKGARGYRGESRVLTWLLGIVHNCALNATRRKRLPVENLESAAETLPDVEDLEKAAESADRRRSVVQALDGLSKDHRAVLELTFFHGLGMAEVARVCGCPIGTVKSRLSYAKAHLRRALERAGLGAEDLL